MLSGETAIGNYPIEAVAMMKSIIIEAEQDFDYRNFFNHHAPMAYHDVTSSVTLATVKTAYSSNAKAIFAFTNSGGTARLLSRLRPQMPILAMTSREKTYHQLAINWGVVPVLSDESHSIEEAFEKLSRHALDHRIVGFGDLVLVTGGSPFGVSGTTNMMIVESIGDVLVRGESGIGKRLHAKIKHVHTSEAIAPYTVKDRLIVLAKCDEAYLPLIKQASGIILQNHIDDLDSETFAMQVAREMNKPVVVRAENAFHVLHEGQLVTIDPKKALIYKGAVL